MKIFVLIIVYCLMFNTQMAIAQIIYKKDKDIIEKSKSYQIIEDSEVHFFEPNIEFEYLDGTKLTLHNFREKVVLIYFWATYCNECVKGLQYLDDIIKEIKFKGLQNIEILAISVDYKDNNRISKYLLEQKIALPVAVDKKRNLMSALDANEIPAMFIIDAQGYVTNSISGNFELSKDVLLPYLKELYMHSSKKVVETVSEKNIIDEQIISEKDERSEYQN